MPASDRRWCLWGIQDHTGGPARSTSIKPISDVAPALLVFYPFSCAVVRLGAWFTGGEVGAPISGRLLHDPFERRGAGLFRRFSSQPAHQLNESDCGGNSHMAQMGFVQTDIPRAA